MTVNQDKYHEKLQISRNKAKMLINYHLNLVTDSIIIGEDPILPIPSRSGFLEYHKNPEKFGNYTLLKFI